MPDSPLILNLVKFLKKPLITTSINLTGQVNLNSPSGIINEFPQIDLLIDGGELPDSEGSTIIDISNNSLRILRLGDFSPDLIQTDN
jgi:tRNA A37 threonylcarbamoyladenosine synthetase subunit TsaC/SUA5/YrdC